MIQRRVIGASWVLVAVGFLAAAILVPADVVGWFDRIWTVSLLAAAVAGFLVPERELLGRALTADALFPASGPERHRQRRAFVGVVTGAAAGIGGALVVALASQFDLDSSVFLCGYGLFAGLTVSVHAWFCAVFAGNMSLRFWPNGDSKRRLALKLLQQPIASIAALAVTGILLLLASMALREPMRLGAQFSLHSTQPRSMWVGVTFSLGVVAAAGVWSIRQWAVQGGRMLVAARTARAQLVYGERTLAFEQTQTEAASTQGPFYTVRCLTLVRGLPPVRGLSLALATGSVLLALFSTNPALDAVVGWATPLWIFTIAGLSGRALQLARVTDNAARTLHAPSASESASSRFVSRWMVAQVLPALLIAPLASGLWPALWQMGCSAASIGALLLTFDAAGRSLRWLTPALAGISLLLTYL